MIADHVAKLLCHIEKCEITELREGLRDTPFRVAKSYLELYSGYNQSPKDILTVFEPEAYSEMIILKRVEFVSTCEHHMLPFFGKASIAYIPDQKIVGISKLARVLEIYTRRLQIQERICTQVTDALMEHLKPLGAACILEAQHFCMICRGVNKQHSVMVTSSLQGAFKTEFQVRQEFLSLIRE